MKNRQLEYERRTNIQNGWKISLKYANILNENISNDNDILDDNIINSIEGYFIKELKSNKLRTDNRMKYMRCWETMCNTNTNNKSAKHIRNAIKHLQYTSHINYNI